MLTLCFVWLAEYYFFSSCACYNWAKAETNAGSCRDMHQGYLTGHLSSGLGAYQGRTLKKEFKSVTSHFEEWIKILKERKTNPDIQKMQGIKGHYCVVQKLTRI